MLYSWRTRSIPPVGLRRVVRSPPGLTSLHGTVSTDCSDSIHLFVPLSLPGGQSGRRRRQTTLCDRVNLLVAIIAVASALSELCRHGFETGRSRNRLIRCHTIHYGHVTRFPVNRARGLLTAGSGVFSLAVDPCTSLLGLVPGMWVSSPGAFV